MDKKSLLIAVNFDFPQAIPVIFHINLACWDSYDRQELAQLVELHPALFPEGIPEFIQKNEAVPYPEWCREGELWTDPWGCLWETRTSGFIGTVVKHPITDLSQLHSYTAPDPAKTTHWYPVTWKKGQSPTGGSIGFFDCLRSGEIGHGHTFLKMIDILGYEKALFAMHDDAPELPLLLDKIEKFNRALVERFISYADVQWLGYAEDLGMQVGPMLSPQMFRHYILPIYRNIMAEADRDDIIIHMHSNGDIRLLFDDLRTLPIRVFNIQDTANTIPWLQENFRSKVALDLDIDRMHITQQKDANLVKQYLDELLQSMYDPAGGLILTYGLYPGTPIENIRVMMDYLEDVVSGGKPWIS